MKISKVTVDSLRHARCPGAIPYRLTQASVETIAIALLLGEEDQAKLAALTLCIDEPKAGEHNIRVRHVNFYRPAEAAHDPDAYTCGLSLVVFGAFCTLNIHVTGISERLDMADPSQQLNAIMQIDCYTDEERAANDEAQRLAFEEQEARRLEEANRSEDVHHCQMGATSIRIGVRAARALVASAKPNENFTLVVPTLLADAVDANDNVQVIVYNDETGEWPKSEVRGRTNNVVVFMRPHKTADMHVEAQLEGLRLALANTLLTEGGDAFVIYL